MNKGLDNAKAETWLVWRFINYEVFVKLPYKCYCRVLTTFNPTYSVLKLKLISWLSINIVIEFIEWSGSIYISGQIKKYFCAKIYWCSNMLYKLGSLVHRSLMFQYVTVDPICIMIAWARLKSATSSNR